MCTHHFTHIAHIRRKDNKQQLLAQHLLETSQITAVAAEKIGLSTAGQLIGLAHDLGKYSQAFQVYIKSATGLLDPDLDEDWIDAASQKGKIDHSSAGAQWLFQELSLDHPPQNWKEKNQQLTAQMLALAVASHHGGLIDCIAALPQQIGQDQYTRRIEKDSRYTHLDEVRTVLDDSIQQTLQRLLQSNELVNEFAALHKRIVQVEKQYGGNKDIHDFKLGLVARFLLSCLIEGDHRSSAEFETPASADIRRQPKAAWSTLIGRLETKLNDFDGTEVIDQIRSDISQHCLAAASRPRGIYTLTVPTGGGKTLASLRFALHHARQHGLDRIIYVIPFTSIIDQNAATVRNILEPKGTEPGSILLEHHSNLLPEKITWQHKLLSENWDVPVIYTTSVQLLESLFGCGTRNTRRMHALANSVLIFDEVQTLPLKCAHLFANALNFLVEHANSSAVLCTATQPLLHAIDPLKGAIRLAPDPELMPDVSKLFTDLKRTNIIDRRKNGGWTYDEAADLIQQTQREHRSTLAIVNTKRAAKALFKLCCKQTDVAVYHLSTSMCPAHRRAILAEIRQKLDNKQPIICVSTQLIEAGVDVSFGSVVRSMAGLDSIAQAAGRCNRHKEQDTAPVFVINLAQEKIELLTEIVDGQKASERLLLEFTDDPAKFQHDLLADQAMRQYFQYYFFDRRQCMDYPVNPDIRLLSLLGGNSRAIKEYRRLHADQEPSYPLRQAFRTASKAFKVIDSPTQSVIVPYGETGCELIAKLNGDLHPQQLNRLLREAQPYSVNLFEHDFKALLTAEALHQTPSGIWCLDQRHSHPDFGVDVEPRAYTTSELDQFIQ